MTTDQLLAELETMLAARKERKMGDYKVVPVELKEFSKGATHPIGDCGNFVSGIDHNITITNPYQWDHQIEVYGSTPEQAEALRDRVLGALESPDVQGEPGQPPLQMPDFATDPDDSDEVASLWDHGFKRGWNACLEAATKTMQPAEQQPEPSTPTFQLGDHVRKTSGSQWKGRAVGTYSTTLTPEGYAVESDTEKGSVQIYPVGALELAGDDTGSDVSALVEALELISDTDPNEGTAWFHEIAYRALVAHRKQEST